MKKLSFYLATLSTILMQSCFVGMAFSGEDDLNFSLL